MLFCGVGMCVYVCVFVCATNASSPNHTLSSRYFGSLVEYEQKINNKFTQRHRNVFGVEPDVGFLHVYDCTLRTQAAQTYI